jgi:SAM-dependent methyltransferase
MMPLGTNDPALRQGWFYRTVAPDPNVPVLAVGAPFARRWFPNAIEGTLPTAARAQGVDQFGLVIVHGTLSNCVNLIGVFRAAANVIAPGGILALAGFNRLRPDEDGNSPGLPRATLWEYRHAARRAGFREVQLYAVRPALADFTFALSLAKASARAFYRFDLSAQLASGNTRWFRRRSCIVKAGLAPWFEPAFVVVGRQC